MDHPCSRPEPLELRIAPAQFFLSGTAFAVAKADGSDANEVALAASVGAGLAFHVAKGDTVVLDANGNHVADSGEVVYATILAGNGIVFATNLDATAGVGTGDISGLAIGTGFNATITGSVNGSVVTAVAPDGAFTPTTLIPGTISGLTVSGQITKNLLAGSSISNVSIGGATPGVFALSVQEIRAGSAADGQDVTYNGGGMTSTASLAAPAPVGSAGASISQITLADGASLIQAGDGLGSAVGPGGKGGSVSGVTFTGEPSTFEIRGGIGGSSLKSKGGDGGSITGLNISSGQNATAGDISKIQAGEGGMGTTGGKGGSVTTSNFNFTAATGAYLYIYGGEGGGGIPAAKVGNGGAGGSVSSLTFTAAATFGFAGFYGGKGGDATTGTNGKGGAGGGVSGNTYQALGSIYAPDFQAGDGGKGAGKGAGGNGGSLSKLTINQGDTDNNQDITGGAGGMAEAGKGGNGGGITGLHLTAGTTGDEIGLAAGKGASSISGTGGNGGAVSGSTFTAGDVTDRFRFEAGAGGSSTNGKGGVGGAFSSFTASLADSGTGGVNFLGGTGGNGGKGGGAGGAASKVTLTLNGDAGNFVSVYSGAGGSALAGDSRGGNAGALSGITVTKQAGAADFISLLGSGGGAGSGTGVGGNSGSVSRITYHGVAAANMLYIGSAPGGDSSGDGARGGNGGSISNVTLDIPASATLQGAAIIYGGNGGMANGTGGKGGNGGNVSKLHFAAPNSTVRINQGPNVGNPMGGTGGSGDGSAGGKGGSVSGVSGQLGLLVAVGQRGGSADSIGGAGGNVSGVSLSAVSQFVQLLAGGVGGDTLGTGTPGKGGSVSSIKLPSTVDIGNFTAAFNVDPAATPDAMTPGMGGIVAGLAGIRDGVDFDPRLNGSVSKISAGRIAAIIAGNVFNPGGIFDGTKADALTESNAVSKISGLKAAIIGADTGAAGFTFTDNPSGAHAGTFVLGDGDTAIDGLVIYLAGKGTFPIEPLKKIEVSLS